MHADMWAERLRDEPRFREAVDELWPYSLGILTGSEREVLCERVGLDAVEPIERAGHTDDLQPLWEEMTTVRRSVPGAAW
jgi:1,2-phenylacetyl-CoA epoxidase catalytic subunit